MMKLYCDICVQELKFENRISVSGWDIKHDSTYCTQCFREKKNWNIIVSRAAERTHHNSNPIAIQLQGVKIDKQ